ncbi:MAG: triose-phosphate isomerase [Paracoccus sp. (in: a-proteobacteria)]|nr:triose-phosphate isomerase [Paracoccus sp. (in: a-proteobacteria)]
MAAPRKLAAGNWKMNGMRGALSEIEALARAHNGSRAEIVICPPATLIAAAAQAGGSVVAIGGQDCHRLDSGAHTGDISAPQLRDAGASHVIVGHSERRTNHAETDAMIADKAIAAHEAGLVTIICVGETEAERDGGETLDVIAGQLAGSVPECATAENSVIAYEPVWAIGTGRTPTNDQITEVHALLRERLMQRFADGEDFRLLYGGSVKPSNASEIFALANVDGALVGGASLKESDFSAIIAALNES